MPLSVEDWRVTSPEVLSLWTRTRHEVLSGVSGKKNDQTIIEIVFGMMDR